MAYENRSAVQEAERLISEAKAAKATSLSLAGLRIRRLPESLGELQEHLRVLDLSGCSSLRMVDGLSGLTDLRHLDLSGCGALSSLACLSSLSELRHLDLSGCGALSSLACLSGLSELRHLDLSGCGALSSLACLSDLSKLQHLDLTGCGTLTNLECVSGLSELQYLDLRGCGALTSLEGVSTLSGLRHLDLSWCRALTSIEGVSSLSGLQQLDLSWCEAVSSLEGIFDLSGLQHLSLRGGVPLSRLDGLSCLSGLQYLALSAGGALTSLEALSGLSDLRHLDLRGCNALTSLEGLSALSGLQQLDLGGCDALTGLQDLSALSGLQQLDLSYCFTLNSLDCLSGLSGLRHLALSGCISLTNLDGLYGLPQLRYLRISNCFALNSLEGLSGLPGLQHLDLSGCGALTSLEGLSALSGLKHLALRNCLAMNGLEGLSGLPGLQHLDLSGCVALTKLEGVSCLSGLQYLDLNGCEAMTSLEGLSRLSELQHLTLNGCEAITSVEGISGMHVLRVLSLSTVSCDQHFMDRLQHDLPRLSHLNALKIEAVPEEILGTDCLGAIEDWLDDLSEGQCPSNQLKLMVLGNGRAGKTQIVRKLRGDAFDPQVPTTHGIQTCRIDHPEALKSVADVNLQVWDFGGQDLYLGTHSMFIDDRAVCMLVWSKNTENERQIQDGVITDQNRSLAYWLHFIRAVAGPKVPVIVVQSQCDNELDVIDAPVPGDHGFERLRRTYCSAKSLEDDGMERLWLELRAAVRYQQERQRLSYFLPLSWMAVKDRLNDELRAGQKTLSWDAYEVLCSEHGVKAPKTLLRYLHESGAVFWREGVFDAQLVLDQAWALEGVYALLHRQEVLPILRQNQGRFSREMLSALLWKDRFTWAEQDMFIDMMKRCGICFSLNDEFFVAPDALPDQQAVSSRANREWGYGEAVAAVRLQYDFLHEGALRTILSKVGEQAGTDAVYWRHGCCVHDGETGQTLRVAMSQVLGDGARSHAWQILIEAKGPLAQTLVTHLQDSIQTMYTVQTPAVEWLIQTGGEGRLQAERARPGSDQPEAKPTEAFSLVPQARPSEAKAMRPVVFVSYKWGGAGEAHVNRIDERLGDEIDIRRDKRTMQVGDSIRKFERDIGRAPHVLMMLGDEYLKSRHCMLELTYMYQHAVGDQALFLDKLIPVLLAGANIHTTPDRLGYYQHWQNELAALERLVLSHGPTACGVSTAQEIKDINSFLNHVVDTLNWLSDTVMPRGTMEVDAANEDQVLDFIRRKVGVATRPV